MANNDDINRHRPGIVGSSSSYFHGAHHFNLTNPHFTNIQGDYYQSSVFNFPISKVSHRSSDISLMAQCTTLPLVKCHPGTRTKAIEMIREWIEDSDPQYGVVWLHGSAGVGKSALMQTISRLLHQENMGRYGGSFFFANGVAERNNATSLFPTLAYQIAVNFPVIRPLIEAALNRDMTLPTKDMPTQVQSLLMEPFKLSPTDFSQHTPTVIIDGLDECMGSPNQTRILQCIANAQSSGLPIRFLIASRPEHWIKSSFSREPLLSCTDSLSLNDQYLEQDSYEDIRTYLEDGFADIYALNSDIIGDSDVPWPSSKVIDKLVDDASGQFIYASTVLKFVGYSGDFYNPRVQLNILLKEVSDASTPRSYPFSEIDKLYMRILSTYPRPAPLKKVLGGLLLGIRLPIGLTALISVDLDEAHMIFSFLGSVLEIKETPTPLDVDKDVLAILFPRGSRTEASFPHKSFSDFLLDQERSGNFAVDTHCLRCLRDQIVISFLESTVSCLRNRDFGPHEMYNNRETYTDIEYISRDGNHHSRWSSIPEFSSVLSDLDDLLRRFSSTGPVVVRPDILLCSLDCTLSLVRGLYWISDKDKNTALLSNLISLLEEKCFPSAVEQMIDSGYLPVNENLITTSSLHNPTFRPHRDLPWISPEALRSLPRGSKGPPTAPWINMSMSLSEETENDIIVSINEQITDRLKEFHTGTDHHERYRAVYIYACHFDLVYITKEISAEQYHSDSAIFYDICIRLKHFFDSPFLSDITGDIYKGNPLTRILQAIDMALGLKWARYKFYKDFQPARALSLALLGWRNRQMQNSGLIEKLKVHSPTLELKLKDFPKRLFEAVISPSLSLEPTESTFPELIEAPISSDGRVDPLYADGLKFSSKCNVYPYLSDTDYTYFLQDPPDNLGTLIIDRLIEAYLNIVAHELFHCHLLKEVRRSYFNTKIGPEIPFVIQRYCKELVSPTEQIIRPLRMIRCWSENYVFDQGFGNLVTCILEKLELQEPLVVSPKELQELKEWVICLKELGKRPNKTSL